MHRILNPADYRRMPWKNGGGVTTEIATYPSGAGLGSFDWRVSIADVVADGPFSRFPGVDRVLVLLAGAGIRLAGEGHDADLRGPFDSYSFSGDDAIGGGLVAGPVRDFNLMLRRRRARGGVTVVRAAGGRVPAARFRLSYAAAGTHECLYPGHAPLTVAEGSALLVEPEDGGSAAALIVNPVGIDAVALVAAIDVP